jgi:hypothetical protein
MRIWSTSAVDQYYRDPPIVFFRAGNGAAEKRSGRGYYVVPHCSPTCCQAFGGLGPRSLGPFSTRVKARTWSRKYLVEPGTHPVA